MKLLKKVLSGNCWIFALEWPESAMERFRWPVLETRDLIEYWRGGNRVLGAATGIIDQVVRRLHTQAAKNFLSTCGRLVRRYQCLIGTQKTFTIASSISSLDLIYVADYPDDPNVHEDFLNTKPLDPNYLDKTMPGLRCGMTGMLSFGTDGMYGFLLLLTRATTTPTNPF